MPMGSYKDFDECLLDQKSKGHDADSAAKICGAMKSKLEEHSEKKEIVHFLTKETQMQLTPGKNSLVGILSSCHMDRGKERISKELIKKWGSETKRIPLLSVHKNDWREQVGVIVVRKALGDNEALYIESKLMESTPTAKAFQAYLKELTDLGMGVGLSIGAIPISKESMEDSETHESYWVHKDAELVEGSVVPIGANREAYGYLAKKFNLDEEPIKEVMNMDEPMKKENPAELVSEKPDYSVDLKKIMEEIEALKKENQSIKGINEKAIEDIVVKAIASLKAEKQSVPTQIEKASVPAEKVSELAAVTNSR